MFLKSFIAAKEKLEIVIGAAEPRFAGLAPRRRRRRNAFGLIQEYSTIISFWKKFFHKNLI